MLARSPLPVLIEGETGTGKSFFAEHVLHPRSGAKGPLVVTDLSTVPSTLMPAHLFGSRRGSYTGAVEDHAGVFEQAHGGTLFLDEIANLDLELQRQLLLVLERGAVTRLGDVRQRPAAPRLVAATNLDLLQLVREGRFRHDLYMRLNPATRLRVPPLRERREDLPDLVRFALLDALRSEALRPLVRAYLARFPTPEDFREEANAVLVGKPQASRSRRDAFSVFLSSAALQRLSAHDWPGNHRELKLFASNALVFALAQHLDVDSTPLEPGSYRVELKVKQNVRTNYFEPRILARFTVAGPAGAEPGAAVPHRWRFAPAGRSARSSRSAAGWLCGATGRGPCILKIRCITCSTFWAMARNR